MQHHEIIIGNALEATITTKKEETCRSIITDERSTLAQVCCETRLVSFGCTRGILKRRPEIANVFATSMQPSIIPQPSAVSGKKRETPRNYDSSSEALCQNLEFLRALDEERPSPRDQYHDNTSISALPTPHNIITV